MSSAEVPQVTFAKPEGASQEAYELWREQVANVSKHWVRLVTACNSKCVFCLDSDTPRDVFLPTEQIKAELRRGREEHDAWKVILSGGEASLHKDYVEIIRYAKEIGYGRIQTVTNGWKYADKDFYEACVQAGLQEITFSLHGHTPELHNRLTQHKGSFTRIVKAIRRAVLDPRMICSVDVVINKQNVAVLDRIVQLAIKLGVTEFDLLHVIPQAAGFTYRDLLFYNPREHLPVLRKVFRLGRHPRFVVWTNRFPVAYLEGMEDLIQDPHKMLDEVNGRRVHVRNYLDQGTPLSCRDPERCRHCFIESFCQTMDEIVAAQNEERVDVWRLDAPQAHPPDPLPYGARQVAVELPTGRGIPAHLQGQALRLSVAGDRFPPRVPEGSTVVARTEAQVLALAGSWPEGAADVVIELNRSTEQALRDRAGELQEAWGERLTLHQPTFEHLAATRKNDIRNLRAFFEAMPAGLRVGGLPACLIPGMTPVRRVRELPAWVFDARTGRPDIRQLTRWHVIDGYRSHSSRCDDCLLRSRCEGLHVNAVRDQGLGQLTPLVDGSEAERMVAHVTALHPEPLPRVADGRPAQAAAASLPGFEGPGGPVVDPLSLATDSRGRKRHKPRTVRWQEEA